MRLRGKVSIFIPSVTCGHKRYHPLVNEWLEADGLGGFAMGTTTGIRSRRYHALRCSALRPPSDRRMSLVGVEAWVESEGGTHFISSHRYGDGGGSVVHPDGIDRIQSFAPEPWPTWNYQVPGGQVRFELLVPRGRPVTILRWMSSLKGRLFVRPMLADRDFHSLQKKNDAFRFGVRTRPGRFWFKSYDDAPELVVDTDATYVHEPEWFLNFTYPMEVARGLDDGEDLASPGVFVFDLDPGRPVHWVASLDGIDSAPALVAAERARRLDLPPLQRALESYLVRRGEGLTVIAGYPWFGDWGRDTFIALRGIRHLPEGATIASAILKGWAGVVSQGMLPNRFPDRGDEPEYNAVDASLWYVLAARDQELQGFGAGHREPVFEACRQILDGYRSGTRYGIRMDEDGLLMAGTPGVQLTWMDAKVGDWVVTPRMGKPVEVQALWLQALAFGQRVLGAYDPEPGLRAFRERFWMADRGYLKDVVDVNHERGSDDARLRPNQVLAVPLLETSEARRVLQAVEEKLLTPLGLRSLAPDEDGYAPRYQGGVLERDGAYHQGTVWPWLIGPFVDAWLSVREDTREVRAEARRRFVDPLMAHLSHAGLGHVSEIADAEAPHHPRGAPFQAWSVSELFRLVQMLS
ncbi:MAG: amylo-alpha-1,6-glucosidase [Myxococcota bacterium]